MVADVYLADKKRSVAQSIRVGLARLGRAVHTRAVEEDHAVAEDAPNGFGVYPELLRLTTHQRPRPDFAIAADDLSPRSTDMDTGVFHQRRLRADHHPTAHHAEGPDLYPLADQPNGFHYRKRMHKTLTQQPPNPSDVRTSTQCRQLFVN